MGDSFDDRRRAAEEKYFLEQEKKALARLQAKKDEAKPRLSPITGKPMEQVNVGGVIVDRCVDSGGIFLDAGELEEIIKTSSQEASSGWFKSFAAKLKR